MEKPDPYGEWVLFGTNQEAGEKPHPVDEDLLAAAREAWPHVLAHVRRELIDKESGSGRTALAADIWERVLRSVAKTRQRGRDHQPPISNLQSYLIGAFHHRFNRLQKSEHKRQETIELVASTVDLELIESAVDTKWADELERAITLKQITNHMDRWTKKVWQARQYGYSWKEISSWLGVSEEQARKKFEYSLEKLRQSIVRLLKRKNLRPVG